MSSQHDQGERSAGDDRGAGAGALQASAPKYDPEAGFTLDLNWQRWWTLLPELLVALLAALLPILIATNVVARYTGWFYVFWVDDVVKVVFLWIVFLGGAVATKYGAHVRMGILSDRVAMAGRAGRIYQSLIDLSPVIVGAILLILGFRLTEISMRRELPSLHVPAGYFTTIVPISGALMIYYALRKYLSEVTSRART
jgi:TRAP-type C4-dicarboxylate transport system permease small subunit